MKLVQYYLPDKGERLGILTEDDEIIDVTSNETPNTLELLKLSYKTNLSIGVLLADVQEKLSNTTMYIPGMSKKKRLQLDNLDNAPDEDEPHLLMPINPPEVWGCKAGTGSSERPEIFFKAEDMDRCVGPNEPICIPKDSNHTAAKPELASVLGEDGEIVGYTICNYILAWHSGVSNPFVRPQSKTFSGGCAIGPVFTTPSELGDVYNLEITYDIIRDNETISPPLSTGLNEVSSSQTDKRFEEIAEFLCFNYSVPIGTVVSIGTGAMIPKLQEGDVVKISINGLGVLSNPVKKLS